MHKMGTYKDLGFQKEKFHSVVLVGLDAVGPISSMKRRMARFALLRSKQEIPILAFVKLKFTHRSTVVTPFRVDKLLMILA